MYDSNAALFVTLSKYMLYFGFSIHIVSCMWYLVGTLDGTYGNYVRNNHELHAPSISPHPHPLILAAYL